VRERLVKSLKKGTGKEVEPMMGGQLTHTLRGESRNGLNLRRLLGTFAPPVKHLRQHHKRSTPFSRKANKRLRFSKILLFRRRSGHLDRSGKIRSHAFPLFTLSFSSTPNPYL